MNVSLEYFLVIVKEESIARAAEKLFITPQNLSNHLKRLETKYGTLFLRSPRFQLTDAGKALVRATQNLKAIEHRLDEEIKALNGAQSVTLRIGIHAARARMLLPRILQSYMNSYPSAKLIFSYKDVLTCSQMLKDGELDLFFGTDAPAEEDFEEYFLEDEPLYFVASNKILTEADIDPFSVNISLGDLDKFSYFLYPKASSIRNKLEIF